MAETQRTIAQLLALYADNSSGDISAEDLRDMVETFRPNAGTIVIADPGDSIGVIGDTFSYFEVTNPAWALSPLARNFDESAGNGRLTYTGATQVLATALMTFSVTCAGVNKLLHFRLGKNGTDDGDSEVQRFVATGDDVGAGVVCLSTLLNTGDYISAFVRNETSATEVTLVTAQLGVSTVPV